MTHDPTPAPALTPTDALQAMVDHEASTARFAEEIASSVAAFLRALRAIAREASPGQAVSLLLLEISQVLLAGARLGAQRDVDPHAEFQPDVGPDADLDDLRLRLATLLGPVDTYSLVFDPYLPERVESQLSDDIATIAADLENGLRHYRAGNVAEALWWWQFSYVSSWGNLAGAALNALISVVAHDRLDVDRPTEAGQIEAGQIEAAADL